MGVRAKSFGTSGICLAGRSMWINSFIASQSTFRERKPGLFELFDGALHGSSESSGRVPREIITSPTKWSHAISFPLRPQRFLRNGKTVIVKVEAKVIEGSIGIGWVGPDRSTYLSPEVERSASNGPSVFELVLEPSGPMRGYLLVRNTAAGQRSRVVIYSIRTFETDAASVPDLIKAPKVLALHGVSNVRAPALGNRVEERVKVPILITHTSRPWEWEKATRQYLSARYENSQRLVDLPSFDQLPPHPTGLYCGGLTAMEVNLGASLAEAEMLWGLDSRHKIQHACRMGSKLVLCFEHFLGIVPAGIEALRDVGFQLDSKWCIDDNWFGGLHTVFPVDESTCLVSSSGADAVLWVDIEEKRVVRRWRVPSEVYGKNYDLTPDMSVIEHYPSNDVQLTHLNCAYPDGNRGCYISTLLGDIGHVDDSGNYSILARGYAGCHGVRVSSAGEVYFADSCGGRMLQITPQGSVIEAFSLASRWLHDVLQLDKDRYLFCLGDTNEIVVADVHHKSVIGTYAMGSRGANVQFVAPL